MRYDRLTMIRDAHVASIERLEAALEMAISATPTSPLRNTLTEMNIMLQRDKMKVGNKPISNEKWLKELTETKEDATRWDPDLKKRVIEVITELCDHEGAEGFSAGLGERAGMIIDELEGKNGT